MFGLLRFERWLHAAGLSREARRVRDEIDAEIADHLASATAHDRAESVDAREAQARAQARFGPIEPVVLRCLWIHLGGQTMLRTLGFATLLVACLLSAGLALHAWSSVAAMNQRAMALVDGNLAAQKQMLAQLESLSGELARLRAAPATPAAAAAKAPAILGKLVSRYDKKPVPLYPVRLLKLPAAELYRQFYTDAEGRFALEQLPPGDYTIVAKLIDLKAAAQAERDGQQIPEHGYVIQSQPLLVGLSGDDLHVELDLTLDTGHLAVEFDKPIARQVCEGTSWLVWQVNFWPNLQNYLPAMPIKADSPPPRHWPVRGIEFQHFAGGGGAFPTADQFAPGLGYEMPFDQGRLSGLPVDKYLVRAWVHPQIDSSAADDPEVNAEIQSFIERLQQTELKSGIVSGSRFGGGGFGGGGAAPLRVSPQPPEHTDKTREGLLVDLPSGGARLELVIPEETLKRFSELLKHATEEKDDKALVEAMRGVWLEARQIDPRPKLSRGTSSPVPWAIARSSLDLQLKKSSLEFVPATFLNSPAASSTRTLAHCGSQ